MKEFEFPYVATRLQFLTGLVTFTTGLAIKSYTTFSMTPQLARAAFFALLATAANMMAYFDHSLVHFSGYFSLVKEFFRLYFKNDIKRNSPMYLLSFGLAILASYHFIRSFVEVSDEDLEGCT